MYAEYLKLAPVFLFMLWILWMLLSGKDLGCLTIIAMISMLAGLEYVFVMVGDQLLTLILERLPV